MNASGRLAPRRQGAARGPVGDDEDDLADDAGDNGRAVRSDSAN